QTITLPLIGGFQAQNALCALGLALACGEDAASALGALEKLEGAPGRMQKVVSLEGGGSVYVDYAHTPGALAAVLSALRPHAKANQGGRLHLVMGCGGDRDQGKRPEMGRVAQELADAVIVTDDNPRGENAADIRSQILSACPGALEIGDRAEAIGKALSGLAPGDILVIAGKGHEQGQIVGDEILPFNDADAARACVKELGL
ncbi:MAG TPA: UDP-N-acetylmuramoyl-L-alanyl-D-glutamate--2,6-diaminopimelate ligase, partial [Rhodospirillales bacterium]|nr:UDP-N-acetylmuramoyl-L-alanyl-D-glutamate--2,6-diaminopimelate ligase [Rhodospirillales bacterium]